MLKKIFSILGSIMYAAMVLAMVAMVFFIVKGKLEGGAPSIAGYKLYIVLSGSMSPVFDAGSVIAVQGVDPQNISEGDIITFKDPEDSSRVVTHRVMETRNEKGMLSFVTKGDANDAVDSLPVPAGNVLGRAAFWVPYAGYLMDFAKSKKGLLVLIVVPGALFILSELRNLFRYVKEYEEEEKRKKERGVIGEHREI